MKGKKIDFMQTAKVSGVITGAALALNWFFATFLNQTVGQLFSAIPAVSPITGTIGEKFIAVISTILPIGDITFMSVFAIFISSFVIVLLGEWIIDMFRLPTFKGMFGMTQRMGRLASVIIYGSIPVYLVLVGTTVPTFEVFVGVAIYTVMLSVLAILAAGVAKLKI